MDLYADNILDHYRSPRGQEPIDGASIEHREENASCGDALTLYIRIEHDVIQALSWSGTGCAISQAAMSILSEELVGMPVAEASTLGATYVNSLLGVPVGPRRTKCALLGLLTVRNALRKQKGECLHSWNDLMHLK